MGNIEILKLSDQDVDTFIELIKLFEDVFEMTNLFMPEVAYLQQLLKKQDFYVFAAMLDNKVVGGLTSYVLDQYYSNSKLLYVYDLAVKTTLQRQGIGRKLISGVTNYCKETGIEEVFLQAELVDDYALDFYRSTGAKEELVVHFNYPLVP